MGRPVVLSNGQLFVGLDENGLVHDFYYPYVGLDNLTNARSLAHKIGVWVDGQFSWTDDGSWNISIDVVSDALVSTITMRSDALLVDLEFHDFVDGASNTFIRRLTLINRAQTQREVRIFMHQVFQISRSGRADTVMFVPDDRYLLDYKGRCCLLVAGQFTDGGDFDQFATGNYAIEGKSGTYADAEDGELSGNPVEHSDVDSVLRFSRTLPAQTACKIDYWIVAGGCQSDCLKVHQQLKAHGVEARFEQTVAGWQWWAVPAQSTANKLSPNVRTEFEKSLMIIKAHCDDRGSILASGDSSIFNYGRDYYCYCWPRDAAYAIRPLIRLGIYDEPRRFFDFARDTMHPDGYLMHKYQPDRAIGSTWHPLLHGRSQELAIQEDETAIVIFMLGEYYRASQDRTYIENIFDSFIAPCANFMSGFIDDATKLPHASYDLWEQKFLTTTYTTSTVIAALDAAADLAEAIWRAESNANSWRKAAQMLRDNMQVFAHPLGYFRKGFLRLPDGSLSYDDTLDISSLYGPLMFAKLHPSDEHMAGTLEAVEKRLLNRSPVGGVIRDEHDGYFLSKAQYPGNPWVVCTLWLAQCYHAIGRGDDAKALLDWSLARALPSGALSEQFDPESGSPLGVTPLVWSHAELVNTLIDMLKAFDK